MQSELLCVGQNPVMINETSIHEFSFCRIKIDMTHLATVTLNFIDLIIDGIFHPAFKLKGYHQENDES